MMIYMVLSSWDLEECQNRTFLHTLAHARLDHRAAALVAETSHTSEARRKVRTGHVMMLS